MSHPLRGRPGAATAGLKIEAPVIIYLVRHGETGHNRDSLALGRQDVPLTPRGEQQAEAVAERLAALPISRVYTSPLGRAAQTAAAIARAHGINPAQTHELIELDVGETEGLPFPVVRERYAAFLQDWAGPRGAHVRMPGGESLADVDARASRFLASLLDSGEGDAVVVSHNFVIRALLCRLLGVEIDRFRAFGVDLASLSIVQAEPPRVSIVRLNDICHLNRLEP